MKVPDWPVTIRTPEGDIAEVDVLRATGRVFLCTSSPGVMLNAAQREEFAQAFTAACHEAEGRVSHG